jgi:hypothetical protein
MTMMLDIVNFFFYFFFVITKTTPTKRINKNTPTLLTDIPIERLKEQYQLKQKIKGDKNLPKFGGMIVRADPFNEWKNHSSP